MYPVQSGSLSRTSNMQRVRQMVSPFGSMKDNAKYKLDNITAALNALSHDLWSHPETAYKEKHAHELLTTFLQNEGFEVERNYIVQTGFRATYGFDGGRAIAVIAEYDADPVEGHFGGKNLTSECAIGVALGVKAALDSMDSRVQKGKIIVFGCPAEAVAGKQKFIQAGAFFGISAVLHASPFHRSLLKPSQEALEKVRYKFTGKTAHAGLCPWTGRNALDAAVNCYTSISHMRQQLPTNIRVHGVFIKGGTQPHVVPSDTELLYYITAPSTVELQPAIKKCEECARGAAIAASCRVNIEYGAYYAEMNTNSQLIALYKKHCNDLGIRFPKDSSTKSAGIATDMGNVSFIVPAIHPLYEINAKAACYTKGFTQAAGAPEAQRATLLQAKALTLTAIDLLQPGGSRLMDVINKEFIKISAPPEVTGGLPMQPPSITTASGSLAASLVAIPMMVNNDEDDDIPELTDYDEVNGWEAENLGVESVEGTSQKSRPSTPSIQISTP